MRRSLRSWHRETASSTAGSERHGDSSDQSDVWTSQGLSKGVRTVAEQFWVTRYGSTVTPRKRREHHAKRTHSGLRVGNSLLSEEISNTFVMCDTMRHLKPDTRADSENSLHEANFNMKGERQTSNTKICGTTELGNLNDDCSAVTRREEKNWSCREDHKEQRKYNSCGLIAAAAGRDTRDSLMREMGTTTADAHEHVNVPPPHEWKNMVLIVR